MTEFAIVTVIHDSAAEIEGLLASIERFLDPSTAGRGGGQRIARRRRRGRPPPRRRGDRPGGQPRLRAASNAGLERVAAPVTAGESRRGAARRRPPEARGRSGDPHRPARAAVAQCRRQCPGQRPSAARHARGADSRGRAATLAAAAAAAPLRAVAQHPATGCGVGDRRLRGGAHRACAAPGRSTPAPSSSTRTSSCACAPPVSVRPPSCAPRWRCATLEVRPWRARSATLHSSWRPGGAEVVSGIGKRALALDDLAQAVTYATGRWHEPCCGATRAMTARSCARSGVPCATAEATSLGRHAEMGSRGRRDGPDRPPYGVGVLLGGFFDEPRIIAASRPGSWWSWPRCSPRGRSRCRPRDAWRSPGWLCSASGPPSRSPGRRSPGALRTTSSGCSSTWASSPPRWRCWEIPVRRALEPALALGAFVVIAYGLSERLLPGVIDLDQSGSRPAGSSSRSPTGTPTGSWLPWASCWRCGWPRSERAARCAREWQRRRGTRARRVPQLRARRPGRGCGGAAGAGGPRPDSRSQFRSLVTIGVPLRWPPWWPAG